MNSWEYLKQENEQLKNKLKYIKQHIYKAEVRSTLERELLKESDRSEWVVDLAKRSTLKAMGDSVLRVPFVTMEEFEKQYGREFKAEMYIFIGNPFWL